MERIDAVAARLGGDEGTDGGLAALQRLVRQNGGLHGLTVRLARGGLSRQVQSWIGTGENQPVSAGQVQRVIPPTELHQLAQQAGISDQEASEQVADALPALISQATPQGQLPENDPFAMGLDAVKRMIRL